MFKKCAEDNKAELIKRRLRRNTQDIVIITMNYKENRGKNVFKNVLNQLK